MGDGGSNAEDAAAARRRRWILVAFGLSGAAALSYEVIWTRALSVVLGSTTYAVSSMLATFMLGLAIGGIAGGRAADRGVPAVVALGVCELGIGVLALASLPMVRALPAAYLWVYRTFHLSAPMFFAMQIALCAAVMLLPTILMGMTFPLVARAVVARVEDLGTRVGWAYGANTIGSVAGSLLAGFVLVPALGLSGAALATAGVNGVVGAGLVVAGRRRARALVASAAALYALGAASVLRSAEPWTLVSLYTASRYLDGAPIAEIDRDTARRYERVYAREGPDARVAAFRSRDGELVLQVGGKLEGTTLLDHANTTLLAYLPVAAHAGARRALVIGLGAGSTLAAAKRAVPEVEVVEISEGVVQAVRAHGERGLLEGVSVVIDDARRHLLLGRGGWDVITSEPSYPSDFAVGNLFTREYYALAAERLAEGGVYCQWLPYYLLTNDDVTMMLKTFASVFPFATLWKVPDSADLLLLGSATPFVRTPAEVVAGVTRLNGGSPLPFVLSRDAAALAEIARRPGVPVNTDDHPVLEFRVARSLRVGDLSLLDR